MSRARDLANSADKDITGTLTVDDITLSGNITVGGTVDGRDIATDGTKLDGVEANATADQTGAEIKTAYEAEANTNAYTDAEKTKLSGIETGATADQTKADIDALNIDADTLDGQHGSYYTTYADTAVSNLVDSAPTTLDTLNELAAALGDDPNFATTVTTSIGTKLNSSDYTAADVLTKIKTVDGSGSGLDADTVDGIEGSSIVQTSDSRLTNSRTCNNSFDNPTTAKANLGLGTSNNVSFNTIQPVNAATIRDVTGGFGSIEIDGAATSGWEGYSIGGRVVFMHNNDTISGLYNDVNNHWWIQCINQGKVQLNYSTANKFETTSGGVAVTGALTATGNITAYYSDERLKTKIGDLDGALDKIKQLNGFYYVENDLAKELGFDNDEQQVALSAQEVQAVMPEAVSLAPFDIAKDEETGDTLNVSASGENYLTVDYARLVPLLVEAIKELKAEIEELKNGSTD